MHSAPHPQLHIISAAILLHPHRCWHAGQLGWLPRCAGGTTAHCRAAESKQVNHSTPHQHRHNPIYKPKNIIPGGISSLPGLPAYHRMCPVAALAASRIPSLRYFHYSMGRKISGFSGEYCTLILTGFTLLVLSAAFRCFPLFSAAFRSAALLPKPVVVSDFCPHAISTRTKLSY